MRSIGRVVVTSLLAVAAGAVHADTFPTKPIRLIVGFTPGGAADAVARSIGEALGRQIGQPVVVENRPGAGSSIAAELVAKAAPDGYTMLIASPSSISVNPALNSKLGYKASDLQPVTKVSASPLLIAVNPNTGINSIADLIAAAKKAPGKLNFATAGVGSAPHFGGVLFERIAGVEMTHVPFKGGGPAVMSVVAGDTQVIFATPPSVLPMVRAGRLRALAVTSRDGSALIPDAPGMADAGLPDYAIDFWYGFFVPAATPPDVVKALFAATTAAARRTEVKATLAREGTEVSLSRSPEDFASFLAEDAKLWVRLAKESGAKAE